MEKYLVYITEKQIGVVEVEAENEDEAKDKAVKEYENGNVFWNSSEISEITI